MPGHHQGDHLVADQPVGVLGVLGGGVGQHVQQAGAVRAGRPAAGGLDRVPGDRVDPGEIGGDGVVRAGDIRRERGEGGRDGGHGVEFALGAVVEGVAGEGAPDGVQGEAPHLLPDVEALPGTGVLLPARGGRPGGLGDPVFVAAHTGAGELGLEEASLGFPRRAGGGEDAVADQQSGPVGALDVPVRIPGEYVPDDLRVGDENSGGGPETERGDAARPLAHLGQQLDQFTPSDRHRRRSSGSASGTGRPVPGTCVRGSAVASGSMGSSPGQPLCSAALTEQWRRRLYGSGAGRRARMRCPSNALCGSIRTTPSLGICPSPAEAPDPATGYRMRPRDRPPYPRPMVEPFFADPALASWYDALSPTHERADFAFYLPRLMSARSVLDVGCGTGSLLHLAREAGHQGRLCGLDPGAGMLEQARRRPELDIEWILGDLRSVSWEREFDFVVMTGHAFQVLLGDDELRAALAAVRAALTDGGQFGFETRDPLARAWESWTTETPVEVAARRRSFDADDASSPVCGWGDRGFHERLRRPRGVRPATQRQHPALSRRRPARHVPRRGGAGRR